MSARRTFCDIRRLPTVAALTAWAGEHNARVRYIGPTLEGHAVYEASHGHVTRVAVDTTEMDTHQMPLSWASPLDHPSVPAQRRA